MKKFIAAIMAAMVVSVGSIGAFAQSPSDQPQPTAEAWVEDSDGNIIPLDAEIVSMERLASPKGRSNGGSTYAVTAVARYDSSISGDTTSDTITAVATLYISEVGTHNEWTFDAAEGYWLMDSNIVPSSRTLSFMAGSTVNERISVSNEFYETASDTVNMPANKLGCRTQMNYNYRDVPGRVKSIILKVGG